MRQFSVTIQPLNPIGTIVDVNEVTILENNREYVIDEGRVGIIGIGPNLLPVVTMNGKACYFTRDELIELAYSRLSSQ